MFYIGQKIVCIKAPEPARGWGSPVKGGIYTIRDLMKARVYLAVYLEEIRNVNFDWTAWGYPEIGVAEPAFVSFYFRPLLERKTDIAVFQKILNSEPVSA